MPSFPQAAPQMNPNRMRAAAQNPALNINIGQQPGQPGQGAPTEPGAAPMMEQPDGGMLIFLDGKLPPEIEDVRPLSPSFDENLAEDESINLSLLANDLLEGIEADIQSRAEWVQYYNDGMDLLGLKPEAKPSQGDKSVSRVRHPLLLEAVVRGQSLAMGELLPAAGPVKVRNDGPQTEEQEELARCMERDFNHYLTVTATEYYPDMDRGLFYLYYGGTLFKKVYRCPVRNRPVSECVYAPDLIVSNDATDLPNALRKTQRIEMMPPMMEYLQREGIYVDINLSLPSDDVTPTEQKEGEITGVNPSMWRPKDRPYTVYECYTSLDLAADYGAYKKDLRGRAPYKVSIDKDSRKVLEIRRNWKEQDKDRTERRMFVKYGLVRGLGFMDLGYLHLLGNYAKTLTALLRITTDAGIFSNFPGGLMLKGARSSTNEFNPGPGEFVPVDGGPGITDIRACVMPLPYKDPSATMLQLIEMMQNSGEKVAGTVEIEIGEGRTNQPVGTTMAMIEQQTQLMAACHKRLHQAQSEEFMLLKELFAETPEDLWKYARNPAREWKSGLEFRNLDLVPASDPNIPAQVHRIQQNMALMQMAQAAPQLFNLPAIARRALRNIGISDADELLNPMPANGGQPQGEGGEGKDSGALAQAAMFDTKMRTQVETLKAQFEQQQAAREHQYDIMAKRLDAIEKEKDRTSRERIAGDRLEFDREKAGLQAITDQAKLEQQAQESKAQREHDAVREEARFDQDLEKTAIQQEHAANESAAKRDFDGKQSDKQMKAKASDKPKTNRKKNGTSS